jgi:hypothetical protein
MSATPERRGGLSRRTALTAAAAAAAAPALTLRTAAASPASAGGAAEAAPDAPRTAQEPDFGPHVTVFDPAMPRAEIQQRLNAAFAVQEANQFGGERFAFLFKPGSYQDLDVNIGYYTHVAGLGRSPDDVDITGWVRVTADWFGGNATHNFWRTAENLSVTPWEGSNRWAVSQAAPIRRVHVRGELPLWDGYDGWASGGYMADCKVDRVVSGSQQQWFTRNSGLGEWAGSVWNMVFLGVQGAPPDHFPNPSHTVIGQTPLISEKPYLYIDEAGDYAVFVPSPRQDSTGTSWEHGPTPGHAVPLSSFHIVREGDSAASVNAALAAGRHLLITPGVYPVEETIEVTAPHTIVLGIGLATLVPQHGITALRTADADGIRIAGLLIDAGPAESASLMEIGTPGGGTRHAANPCYVQDVFARVGGAGPGAAVDSLIVHSHDTVIDHVWLWRGDHGEGVGWTTNPAARPGRPRRPCHRLRAVRRALPGTPGHVAR